MDDAILVGISRALKKIYRCDAPDQLPEQWLDLIAKIDVASGGVSRDATSGRQTLVRPIVATR